MSYSIVTVIKASKVTERNIPALKSKLYRNNISATSWSTNPDHVVYGYNIEKHNRKADRFTKAGTLRKKPVVTNGYAVAYVYKFTQAQLKQMGKRLVQGTRNFKLVDLK